MERVGKRIGAHWQVTRSSRHLPEQVNKRLSGFGGLACHRWRGELRGQQPTKSSKI